MFSLPILIFIRLILEYLNQLWSPFRIKFTNHAENIHRSFTKRVGQKIISYLSHFDAFNFFYFIDLKLNVDILANYL